MHGAEPTRPPPIPFSVPTVDARDAQAAADAVLAGEIGGHGPIETAVEDRIRRRLGAESVLMTTSCTHALEAALIVLGIGRGDEVVVPAYGFPSTAGAAVRQGARAVFADSRRDDPQIDVDDVARRLTPRTKAVVVIHYGGVPADIVALRALCDHHGLALVEDAAHAFDARQDGRALGTFGDAGCLSFHASKNLSCGEGGALILRGRDAVQRAEVVRDMGTDRLRLLRGEQDRYTWRADGSSYAPSQVLMAILASQLDRADEILATRRRLFFRYRDGLADLEREGRVTLPRVPGNSAPNGHIFHLLLPDADAARNLLSSLAEAGIAAAPHYECLADTPFGRTLNDPTSAPWPNARSIALRLVRLPLHPRLADRDQDRVIEAVSRTVRKLATPRP